MKTLLTTIMFLVFWTTVYGQVAYENIDIKTNNNYQYVATNNTPANEKYSRVRKWLEEYIPDFKNTIIILYLSDNTLFIVLFLIITLYKNSSNINQLEYKIEKTSICP